MNGEIEYKLHYPQVKWNLRRLSRSRLHDADIVVLTRLLHRSVSSDSAGKYMLQ